MSQWTIWGSTRALLILTEYRTGKRTIWLADVPGPSELNQLCDKRSCEIWGSESVLWIVVGLMLRKYTLIRENGRYENIRELGNNSFNKWWLGLITSILQSAVWAPLIAIANNIKLYVLEWNEPLSFMPFKSHFPACNQFTAFYLKHNKCQCYARAIIDDNLPFTVGFIRVARGKSRTCDHPRFSC